MASMFVSILYCHICNAAVICLKGCMLVGSFVNGFFFYENLPHNCVFVEISNVSLLHQ